MRKVIAAVPVAMVAGYLAFSGAPDSGKDSRHSAVPDAPSPVASVAAMQTGIIHAAEQAHVAAAAARTAAASARAAAVVAEARAGSVQVHAAADAHATVSVSLDGLLEIIVQELERSAIDDSAVELRHLDISVSALAELATELEGMADLHVTDSTVTIIGSADGASVRVHISEEEPPQ
jgi:hypothetical protein